VKLVWRLLQAVCARVVVISMSRMVSCRLQARVGYLVAFSLVLMAPQQYGSIGFNNLFVEAYLDQNSEWIATAVIENSRLAKLQSSRRFPIKAPLALAIESQSTVAYHCSTPVVFRGLA
jgi:hypothetical protein